MHVVMNFRPTCGRLLLRVRVVSLLLLVTMHAALVVAAPPGARSGTSKIVLATQPPGAAIFLDGQASGKTPGEVDGLGAGRYFVRLELDGYRPAELVVELSSGQSYQSPTIELVSTSAPRRAEPAPPPVAVAVARPAPPAPTPVRATPAPARAAPVAVATPPAAAPAEPAAAGDEDETIRRLVAAT